jgi:hypothetical protein
MPTLYSGSGSGSYSLGPLALADADWERRKKQLEQILTTRAQDAAVWLLNRLPWRVFEGENDFGDEFQVLYAHLDTDTYVAAGSLPTNKDARAGARIIADTYRELSFGYLRFIGFALQADDVEQLPTPAEPAVTSASVRRALEDAELMLRQGRPTSAVDRAHTALHGFLGEHARRMGIPIVGGDGQRLTSAALYKKIRSAHPAFQTGPHAEHTAVVGQTLATVVDKMDTLRNNASIAHPNDELLDEPEAQLVTHAVWAILRFLDARLSPLT